MIHFHGGPTPNGQKVAILLEELGAPHMRHFVDTKRGDQHSAAYLAINPNARQPAIVETAETAGVLDAAPLVLWESGAILVHLAEQHGRFLPTDRASRAETLKWLMWQMSALGPTGGQLAYFGRECGVKLPLAIERFALELHRQFQLLDSVLAQRACIAGDYGIADMAIYPWWLALRQVPVVRRRFRRADWLPWFVNLVRSEPPAYRHIQAWAARLAARPAVARGMAAFTEKGCC